MADDSYVCTLDAASAKKSAEELNEDSKNRLGAVATLRQWLKQQTHVNFPDDTRSLLQILRYAKFSQLKARTSIENYCTMITKNSAWFTNFDPFTEDFIKFVKLGMLIVLPKRNKFGQKQVIYRFGAWEPKEWKDKKDIFLNSFYTIVYYCIHDENTQVNGFNFFDDMTGMTMAHHTFYTIDETKRIMKNWQACFPMRTKGVYLYNAGPVVDAILEIVLPFFTQKIKDRMHTMGSNMVDMYKHFPMETLPIEYLPDDYDGPNAGSIDSITTNMLNEMQSGEMLEYLHYISNPKYGIDKSKKPDDVPQASFRKLNID